MTNKNISLETANQSVLFARLSAGVYRDSSVRILPGLKPLENEERFSDDSTDTQGVMGRWNNDVVIAFRGTEAKLSDWLATNAQVGLVNNPRGAGKMHTGFRKAADSVYSRIKQFIRNHKDENSRIFLCGHSLGGALATIVTAWLKNDAASLHPRAVFRFSTSRRRGLHPALESAWPVGVHTRLDRAGRSGPASCTVPSATGT